MSAETAMRIGLDGTFLEGDSLFSGMGTYTLELVRGLSSLPTSDEFTLLGYGSRPELVPDRIHWRQLSRPYSGRYTVWIQHQLLVRRAIRELDLDVFHVPGLNMRLSRPGIPLSSPSPLVVTVHDAIPLVYYGGSLKWRLRLGFWLGMRAARRAAKVITVSETSRRDLLANTQIAPRRLNVVTNGVPRMVVPEAPTRQEILSRLKIKPPYLLYAGSYEPRKNLLSTVAAYREAASQSELPPLVLLVERESGFRAQTLQQIDAMGISSRLHLIHSLSGQELGSVFNEAKLLLYPSLYEGFGLPPLQGMSLGMPVIASDRGALPEILGNAAEFVDPTSIASIKEAILKVANDPVHAANLSSEGKIQARKYQWEETAHKTHEIYQIAASMTTDRSLKREPQRA